MDDLLSAMMNGADPESEEGQGGGMDMADLLGAMAGGSAPGSGSGQSGGMDMGALLGMLGGGDQGASAGVDAASAGGAGGLLGSLLGGGGSSQGSGAMGGLLGALLGGGTGLDSFLAPLVTSLAEKIGLPPEIAQVVVAFALEKLLSGKGGAGAGGRAQGVEGMDELVAQMSRGQSVDTGILESSGMTEELMEKTGLDHETAERSLQEAFDLFGSGMAGGSAPPQAPEEPDAPATPDLGQFSTGGLGGLRDGWDSES